MSSSRKWHCFSNNRTKGDSGCGASRKACEGIRNIRAIAYANREFPFEPSSCEPNQAPACLRYRDTRESPREPKYYQCFQSMPRCELAQEIVSLPFAVTAACLEKLRIEDLTR